MAVQPESRRRRSAPRRSSMCSNLERSSRRPIARSVQADESAHRSVRRPLAFRALRLLAFHPVELEVSARNDRLLRGRGVRARQRLHRCVLQGDRTLPALPLPDSRRSAHTTGASRGAPIGAPRGPSRARRTSLPVEQGWLIASATPLPPSAGEHLRARGSRLPAVRIGPAVDALRRGAVRPDSSSTACRSRPERRRRACTSGSSSARRATFSMASPVPSLATLVDPYRDAEYESGREVRYAAATYVDALAQCSSQAFPISAARSTSARCSPSTQLSGPERKGHETTVPDPRCRALQLSPRSIRRLLEVSGFERIEASRLANRYPLGYWLRLAPVPKRARNALHSALSTVRLTDMPLRVSAGNLVAVGYKPTF